MSEHHDGPVAGRIIAGYEDLLNRSTKMLEQVLAGEWTSLIDEEASYVVRVEQLQQLEVGVQLNRTAREHKAVLLEAILGQSIEIKLYLATRQEMLGRLIEDSRQRRKLIDSYLILGEFGSRREG